MWERLSERDNKNKTSGSTMRLMGVYIRSKAETWQVGKHRSSMSAKLLIILATVIDIRASLSREGDHRWSLLASFWPGSHIGKSASASRLDPPPS